MGWLSWLNSGRVVEAISPLPHPVLTCHSPPLAPSSFHPSTCFRYDVHEMAALKSQFQIASEKGMSQAMFDVDLKVGADFRLTSTTTVCKPQLLLLASTHTGGHGRPSPQPSSTPIHDADFSPPFFRCCRARTGMGSSSGAPPTFTAPTTSSRSRRSSAWAARCSTWRSSGAGECTGRASASFVVGLFSSS